MKTKNIIIIISILLISIFLLHTFLFQKSAEKPLLIGMMNGWAPYMNLNNQGEMEGFDIDVTHEIEKKINKKIIIKDLGSLSSLFIALEQGTVDAIFSGLDITQKRKDYYDFVLYAGEQTKMTECCIVTSKNGPHNENDLKNNKYTIGIEAATSWESTLDKYSLINKLHLTSISDMVLQLNQNKVDCIIIDPIQCNRLKKIMPSLDYFTIDIDDSLKIDGIGIFIKKNNTHIKNILEIAINKLTEENIIKDLVEKWNLI